MRLLKRSLYAAADQHLAAAFDDIAARTAVSDHHRDAKEGWLRFARSRLPASNDFSFLRDWACRFTVDRRCSCMKSLRQILCWKRTAVSSTSPTNRQAF